MSSSDELPGLAEVDEAELAGIEDEDVRRMRVGVEEAVPEDHRHPRVRHPVGDVPALVRHASRARSSSATFVPCRNSSVSTRPVEYCRITRGTTTPVVAREVPVEGLGVPRLVPVVELEPDRARELVDELLRIDELERPHPLLQQPRRLVEEPEIGLDLRRRRRTLDLDRDLLRRPGAPPDAPARSRPRRSASRRTRRTPGRG